MVIGLHMVIKLIADNETSIFTSQCCADVLPCTSSSSCVELAVWLITMLLHAVVQACCSAWQPRHCATKWHCCCLGITAFPVDSSLLL